MSAKIDTIVLLFAMLQNYFQTTTHSYYHLHEEMKYFTIR